MVQKVNVIVTDDLTGEEGAGPVTFSLNRNLFELDLTDDSLAKFRKLLGPYIDAARTASPENRRSFTGIHANGSGRGGGKPRNRDRSADIRAWARKKGYEVSDRGRIPAQIEREYTAEANRTGQL